MILAAGSYLTLYLVYTMFLLGSRLFIKDAKKEEGPPETRFCIIIPAHNEEIYIKRILESVSKQDYSSDKCCTCVVADNCTDGTAKIAREYGALVLERMNLTLRGKGHALGWAFQEMNLIDYDAVLIVDADSYLSGDTLKHLDGLLKRGARIIQCYNGVINPGESWFTRLMDVSRTIGNELLHPAKQKLGLSSYLMGNGMCFKTEVIKMYGWDSFTVGEDWEYYAKLIQSGERVAFSKDARVFHQESSTLRRATSQRLRWASGRFFVAWKYGIQIAINGVKEKNIVKIDASLPLIFPNPSLSMNITIVMIILSYVYYYLYANNIYLSWFILLAIIQLLMFVYGAMLTKNKIANTLSLFISPVFLLWKLCIDILSLVGIGRKEWVPTKRD